MVCPASGRVERARAAGLGGDAKPTWSLDAHSRTLERCVCRAGATRCDAVGFSGLEGYEGGFLDGYQAAVAGALNPHLRYGCQRSTRARAADATGPIGSTPSTKSAERKAGSCCERAFCGRGAVGRTERATLCSTRAAAQEPVPPRRPLPMARHWRSAARHSAAANRLGGDAHGSWSLPSHSRLGGDGEGAPAGGSAGGSKTELNSHSRYAPQCHSTSVASTEHGVTSSAQRVSDAYRCTGCAIATLMLVGCTAATEQRGSTTTRTRAT